MLIIFPCVQESRALISDCVKWSEVCAPWLWWRGKASASRSWCRRWKRVNWIRVLSTRTYSDSLGKSMQDSWTSSLRDSRVNHFQMQVFVNRPKTTDTSGPTSNQGSLFSEAQSASSRTSMESLPQSHPDTTQFSTMSSATWKQWVTEQRLDSSQRRKSAHPISENDGSFSAWPTPTPIHAIRGNHDEPVEKYQQRVRDYEEGRAKGKPGKSLGVAVNWPTASARDWKDSAGMSTTRSDRPGQARKADQLPRAVFNDGPPDPDTNSMSGSRQEQLNPDWVDSLMGFQIGWTDLERWGTQ